MGFWGGLKDFILGEDPEEYKPDPVAATMGGAYGSTDYLKGQMGRAAPKAGNVYVDQGASNQARSQLMGLAGRLNSQGQGQGPSGAAMAAHAQRDQGLAQAAALQAGNRGRNAAAGMRMALNSAAGTTQQAAQNEAIGRANEMTTANAQLGNVLGTVRGQDLSVAGQNAGFQQQTNLANQDAALKARGLDIDAASRLQGQSQAEMLARLEQERMKYGNLDPGSGGFLDKALSAGTTLGAAALLSDRNAKTDVQEVGGRGQLMGIGQRIMPVRRGAANRASDAIGSGVQTLASMLLMKQMEEKDKEARTRKVWDAKKPSMLEQAQRDAADSAARARLSAGVVDGLPFAQPLPQETVDQAFERRGYAISDEKSKTKKAPAAAPVGGHDLMEYSVTPGAQVVGDIARDMIGNLKPYSYEYKPDAGMPSGKHVGVMAQDLEKSRAGKTLVERDPATGYKAVDYLKGLPLMMAGLADQEDRIRRLETKKGK